MDQVKGLPTRNVGRGTGPVTPLPAAARPPAIGYRYRNLGYTLDDYLERQRVTGLVILKDGEIVAERYRYGRSADARFLSFSMAKSVISMLVGVALEQGLIASLDDPAEKYAAALAGSAYGATTIRHLLRMSSGLMFTERYDGADDIARLSQAADTGRPPLLQVLRSIADRHCGRRREVRLCERRNRGAGPCAGRCQRAQRRATDQRMALAAAGCRARCVLGAVARRP